MYWDFFLTWYVLVVLVGIGMYFSSIIITNPATHFENLKIIIKNTTKAKYYQGSSKSQ
jgi:hypothetical protein